MAGEQCYTILHHATQYYSRRATNGCLRLKININNLNY